MSVESAFNPCLGPENHCPGQTPHLWATQSEHSHFSQMQWSWPPSLQAWGNVPSKVSYSPSSSIYSGKKGKCVFKKRLLPVLHNLETNTHKAPGNTLGISWRWRTHKAIPSHTQLVFSNRQWKVVPNNTNKVKWLVQGHKLDKSSDANTHLSLPPNHGEGIRAN